MLSESGPRHIPAAGAASGAAEPGWEQLCPSLPPLSQAPAAPSYTSNTPGCLAVAVGRIVHMCCWRAGLGPNPALLCHVKISQWTQVTTQSIPLWKGQSGGSKIFSQDFVWFWKDEGFVAQPLSYAKRCSRSIWREVEAWRSCHILGAQPSTPMGTFQIYRVGHMEGNTPIQTPRESHI